MSRSPNSCKPLYVLNYGSVSRTETSHDDVVIGHAVQEIVPSDASGVNRETVVDCVMCMFCRETFVSFEFTFEKE